MLLVYTHKESPRFKYIAKQIFERILGIPINVTLKIEEFVAHTGPKFSYSKQPLADELFFQCADLLFEKGINENIITIKDWNGLPCFYQVPHPDSAFPFDIFSASFYMLTRYEEYLPQLKDHLGRFIAKSSIAYQHNFLQEPIIDWWAQRLKKVLFEKYPELNQKPKKFSLTLLCEVNEAFAYKKKGWFRTIEGFAYDFWLLKLNKLFDRTKVIIGLKKDPFSTYNYMVNTARKLGGNLIFFFGLGNYSSHEKSISYNSNSYQKLIKSIADYYPVGLRLSFDSQNDIKKLKTEKKRFEQITHQFSLETFCQYAKTNLPENYRSLIEQEVTKDYSMGYMDNAGFRAGTCTPFLFYDLEHEIQTPLKIIPFCLTNNAFKNIKTAENGIKQAEKILSKIKSVNGEAYIHIQNNLFSENSLKATFWKKMFEYFLNFK